MSAPPSPSPSIRSFARRSSQSLSLHPDSPSQPKTPIPSRQNDQGSTLQASPSRASISTFPPPTSPFVAPLSNNDHERHDATVAPDQSSSAPAQASAVPAQASAVPARPFAAPAQASPAPVPDFHQHSGSMKRSLPFPEPMANSSLVPAISAHIPEPYIFIPMPSRTPSPLQAQAQPQPSSQPNVEGTNPNSRSTVPRGRGRGKVQARRGRGRGRVSRRGRGRGRGASNNRTQNAKPKQTDDPTAGWTDVPSSTVKLMLEKDYVDTHVSQGARLFFSAAMERLTVELDVKKLKRSRSNVFVLLSDELVNKCCEWLNELSVLKKRHEGSITVPNLYRYLGVMLFSQCTGCSFSKTLDMLEKLSGHKLNEDLLSFINSNILAYAATGRGDDESLGWNAQRDQTVMLSQFERSAFRMTARIFMSSNHTILSLDDDLMGTRATYNQVKTISNRKADKEGHVADVLADALFRVVFQLRFRRRHEKLQYCVEKVMSNLLETRGDLSRQGIVVVADRGYAKRHVLNALMDQGLSCFGVMPEFVLECHPFVGKSYLKIAPFVDDEEDEDPEGEEERGNAEEYDDERVLFDRPNRFVVEDGPTLGPGVSVAKSFYKPKDRGREELTAIAVREYGNAKHSKIIRFMYSMRSPWPESLFTWVAIPYERSFRGHLFTTRDDSRRIVEPDAQTYRPVMEQHFLDCCEVLTVGQRCADWFVMRQFRVTATVGSRIITCCPALREAVGYEPKKVPFSISEPSELVKGLCKSWFTTTRATEAMMRGTMNENAVLNYLRRRSYTKSLFSVGILSLKDHPWLASSPDAILMLDLSKIEGPFHDNQVIPCTVEIKTSVSSTNMQQLTSLATKDLVVMDYTNDDIKKYIPEEHLGQIIHQAITANVSACIYVAASESQAIYTIAVMFDEEIITEVASFVDHFAKAAISWAHDGDAHVPLDKYGDDVEDLLLERVPFWKCVNEYVRERGPFMPIRVFRHSAQSYYSKTRGGVDGNSQTRAALKSSSSSQKWEQKVVTHTFKTILVNSFIAWRMLHKEDLLGTRDSFGDLEKYRQKLNRVQCMTDFALDTALELLQYADELSQAECDGTDDDGNRIFTQQQKIAMIRRARKRKRNRILFFNSGDGLELRLHISNHPHVIGERDIYCALCGQNNGKSFRGHRINHKCGYCDVHLCVKVRAGFRKSCWEIWHTAKRLKAKTPMPYRDSVEESNSENGEEAESRAEQPPDAEEQERSASSEEEEVMEAERGRKSNRRKRLRSSADSSV